MKVVYNHEKKNDHDKITANVFFFLTRGLHLGRKCMTLGSKNFFMGKYLHANFPFLTKDLHLARKCRT